MTEPATVHSTFVLEKRFAKPRTSVFAAFADLAVKRRWFAESDSHEVLKFESDFRVGGSERLRLRYGEETPLRGAVINGDGVHLDIVENRRIVIGSTMAFGDVRFSASLVTFEFLADGEGTILICTHQGAFFENSDGPDRRKGGWIALLNRLESQLAE